MGQNKDAAIGFGVIAVIIVIIVGVVVWVVGPGETKAAEQDKSTNIQKEPVQKEKKNTDYTDDEVKKFIMNYKGKDNSGATLIEIISTLIETAYPGENILKSPATKGYFTPDLNYDNYWDVYFDLKTYRESVSFQWTVDMETKSVYAKNEGGQAILDGLDAFD